MKPDELRAFLKTYGLSSSDFADLIGVTPMAVVHWLEGRRSISITVARLIDLFRRRPELMGEFK